jgi:hypothetical protein
MNRFIMVRLSSLFLFLLTSAALAQTQVPNTFQAGQPARAAEVNENFDTIETAVDQNAADILQVQGLAPLSAEAAQIQTGLNLTSGLRWLVADFFMDRGAMPQNNAQTGTGAATIWSNRYVESATVDSGGIEILFRNDAAPQIAGRMIVLRAVNPGSSVLWFDCVGDGVTDAYLAELNCAFSDAPYMRIYEVRQLIVTVFDLLRQSNAQQLTQDFYNANGVWPTDNMSAGLGLPTTYQNKYVTQLNISGNGVITAVYGNDAHAVLFGTRLIWTPTDNGNSVEWECTSPDIANHYLPAECRS